MAKPILPTIAPLGGPSKAQPKPPPTGTDLLPDVAPRRPTVFPQGPRILGLTKRRHIGGGPGAPPPGFKQPSTSATEWYWYWGSWVYLDIEGDPRQPPYAGDGIIMEYQVPDNPTNPHAASFGIADFLYHLGTGDILVRIDTFFYHAAALPKQLARDEYLRIHGQHPPDLTVSAWDNEFVGDATGRAVVAAVANALHGRTAINPIKSGLLYPPRDLIAENEGI